LNTIRFPDHDPTGFCNSDPDRTGFRKNSTGSDLDIQTALITAVNCLIRGFFSHINRIGPNIWTILPVSSEICDLCEISVLLFFVSYFASHSIGIKFGVTFLMCVAEMITIRFAGWISGRIVSLQRDMHIQKRLSNGNRIRIRISATLFSIF